MHDLTEVWRLWCDSSLRTAEVADKLGISTGKLYKLARQHHLPARQNPPQQPLHQVVAFADDGEPEPMPNAADDDGLRLSPWVEKRIAELRLAKLERIRSEPLAVTQSRVSRHRCGRA